VARNRMATLWLPFTTGADELTLAVSSISSVDLTSLAEAEQGRDFDLFTTTRLVLNMGFRAVTGDAIVTVGLMSIHKDAGLATKQPAGDQEADWSYHEEFMITNSVSNAQNDITRDIVARRKQQGFQNKLLLKVNNRDSVSAILFHISGRMLVLLP